MDSDILAFVSEKTLIIRYFHSFKKMSRISHYFVCLLVLTDTAWSQQKSNDFTRRMGNFDGIFSPYSGKSFMNARLNTKLNNRIRIDEWPTKYSPFGGKRFVSKSHEGLIKKRIVWQKLPAELAHRESRYRLSSERVLETDLTNRASATASVEFRDAYYEQLEQRVDDWLNKVNNVSLQEINRYQFRKGRPSEPGFPVQQAGSEGNQKNRSFPSSANSIKNITSDKQSKGSTYWLGPRKTSVQGGNQEIQKPSAVKSTPKGGYRSLPRPVLGPKKVRVEVGTSK